MDDETTAPEAPEAPQAPIGSPAPVTIRDEEPDTDLPDDETATQAARPGEKPKPGSPGTRKERKNLWKENQELKTEIKRQTSTLTQMQSEFRRELDAIRQMATRPQPQQPSQQQDPLDAEIASVEAQMGRELQLMQKDQNYDGKNWIQLQSKLHALQAKKVIRDEMRQQRPNRQQADPYEAADRANRYANMTRTFPWMRDPDNGYRYTKMVGYMYRMLLESGRPDSEDLHMEAAALVGKQLGLGSRVPQRPDHRQTRARAGFGDGERGNGHAPREVQVDPRMLEGLGLPEELIRKATFGRYE